MAPNGLLIEHMPFERIDSIPASPICKGIVLSMENY